MVKAKKRSFQSKAKSGAFLPLYSTLTDCEIECPNCKYRYSKGSSKCPNCDLKAV